MKQLVNKPYIIAEVGSNWSTLAHCLDSIVQAKIAGADAVKFQAYDFLSLFGHLGAETRHDYKEDEPIAGGWGSDPKPHSGYGRLNHELPIEWLPALKEHADKVGIDFMCSAFSPELVDSVDPFVSMHKLASSEMCHVQILEKLRSKNKPVIVSTGGQTLPDIERALTLLSNQQVFRHIDDLVPERWSDFGVILMYCVSSYPAKDVDLGCIDLLRNKFNLDVGYSDHTTDVLTIPYHAVHTHGAVVIEKHFKCIDFETPDSAHSLNPDEFRKMVAHIRGKHTGVIGPSLSETPMVLRHKRRLIAIEPIKIGDKFELDKNYGVYRSLRDDTKAMSPFRVYDVNGKRSKLNIEMGEGIAPDAI